MALTWRLFLKKLLLAILALIFVLGGVVLVGPSFVDWNSYKAEIARTVEQQTGRRLDIEGDISFQVLPAPRLSVKQLKLANLEGGSANSFISASALQIHVDLVPLLSGKVKVASVTLNDPVVALEQFPDGRNNWTFSASTGKTEESHQTAEGSTPSGSNSARSGGNIDFSLDGATINNGRISFLDHDMGTAHSITGLNATLSASSLNGPFRLTGDFAYEEVPVMLSAATGTIDAGWATPLEAIISLGDKTAELSYSGTLVLGDMPRLIGTIGATAKDLAAAGTVMAPLSAGTDALPAALNGPLEVSAKLKASVREAELSELALTAGGLSAKGAVTVRLADGIAITAELALDRFVLDDILSAPANSPKAKGEALPKSPVLVNTAWQVYPSNRDCRRPNPDCRCRRSSRRRNPPIQLEASLADNTASLKVFSAQMPGGSNSVFRTVTASGAPVLRSRRFCVRQSPRNARLVGCRI